jgi:hypothetical protein
MMGGDVMHDRANSPTAGYSAEVSIELQVGAERFSVASFGGDRMIIRSPRALSRCAGTVRIIVDNHVSTCTVELIDGLDPTRRDQPYRLLKAAEAAA